MGKITSIVGLVLIVAAGVLASVSTTYEDQIKAKKELCKKYIKNATEALEQGDKKSALKFVKMALKTDPDNKVIYTLLQKINGGGASTAPTASKKEEKAKPTKKQNAPAAEEEEEEDGLGC